MFESDPCSALGFWIGVPQPDFVIDCENKEECRNRLKWEDGSVVDVDLFEEVGPVSDRPDKTHFRYLTKSNAFTQVQPKLNITALCMCFCN